MAAWQEIGGESKRMFIASHEEHEKGVKPSDPFGIGCFEIYGAAWQPGR